jgi:hypothetical protein
MVFWRRHHADNTTEADVDVEHASDQIASFSGALVAIGPEPTSRDVRYLVAIEGKADI